MNREETGEAAQDPADAAAEVGEAVLIQDAAEIQGRIPFDQATAVPGMVQLKVGEGSRREDAAKDRISVSES